MKMRTINEYDTKTGRIIRTFDVPEEIWQICIRLRDEALARAEALYGRQGVEA